MKNIVIAGGTGLIGKELSKTLLEAGYRVIILSRTVKKSNIKNLEFVEWEPKTGKLPIENLKQAHVIINLSGRNIGEKRWNKSFKQEILNSRIHSTKVLVDFYNSRPELPLEVFINASAVGFYGYSEKVKSETDPAGDDFMAKVCDAWENEAKKLVLSANRRLVIPRFGIVLSADGGAFTELARPIKLGLGAILGSGNQFMSWIHIYDLCKMLQFFIENKEISGVYNAVAPEVVTHKNFVKSLAKELKRPLWLPNVPGFALKLLLGEFAEALLGSSNISAEKIKSSGFKFKFSELQYTLKNLVRN